MCNNHDTTDEVLAVIENVNTILGPLYQGFTFYKTPSVELEGFISCPCWCVRFPDGSLMRLRCRSFRAEDLDLIIGRLVRNMQSARKRFEERGRPWGNELLETT
jgi:hypothetical protein